MCYNHGDHLPPQPVIQNKPLFQALVEQRGDRVRLAGHCPRLVLPDEITFGAPQVLEQDLSTDIVAELVEQMKRATLGEAVESTHIVVVDESNPELCDAADFVKAIQDKMRTRWNTPGSITSTSDVT